MIFFHQILGKRLASLQNRCILSRSEYPEALCLQYICQSAYQRVIRCHKNQIHPLFLCICNNFIKFHYADSRLALCNLCDSRVAGNTIKLIHFFTLPHTDCNRMLTSAAAYD